MHEKKKSTLTSWAGLACAAALLVVAIAAGSPAAAQEDENAHLRPRLLSAEEAPGDLPSSLSDAARERMLAYIAERREAKLRRSPSERKIASSLRAASDGKGRAALAENPLLRFDARGRLALEVRLAETSKASLEALRDLGLEVVHTIPARRSAVVFAPAGDLAGLLERLAGLSAVEHVRPSTGDLLHAGSVLSEGDAAHLADQARLTFGVDGTGVKTCVISDGTTTASAAVATGDLPDDGTGQPAVDFCTINNNSGDEGTAMLEIVHDLAPGSKLGFCPAFDGSGSPQSIANAIDALVAMGCDVIVDDVANLTEPYFQDGVAAQSVDAAFAAGVSYHSSAGNSGDAHYESKYLDTVVGDQLVFPQDTHDFGLASGGASDIDWGGLVGNGSFFAAFLQWNDPFGASGNDYDLYLFDVLGNPAGASPIFASGANGVDVQDGDDDPLEIAFVTNSSGATQQFFIVIDRFNGAPAYLEMNFNGFFTVQSPENYVVSMGSVWGHAAAEGALALAATGAVQNIDGTPNPNLDIIEPFSSQGPAVIFFDTAGNPNAHRRKKPDLTAVDGVSVTGAGGFPSPFYGTSAAAPHSAAITALMLEANPSLNPKEVAYLLCRTAWDRGPTGFDQVWGCGLINALWAVRGALAYP